MNLNSQQIQTLAAAYPCIPLYKEIYADLLTPISILLRLREKSQSCCLLESMEGQEKWGRYSFLGYDPVLRLRLKKGELTIEQEGETLHPREAPFACIRRILKEYEAPRLPGLPPFTGGFVGCFGYGLYAYAEPTLRLRESDCSDLDLLLFDKVIAFDHLKQKVFLIVHMATDDVLKRYGEAMAKLEQMNELLRTPLPGETPKKRKKPPIFSCNVTKEAYGEMVEQAKIRIREGDIFQAVLSRQFTAEYEDSLLDAYRVLRTENPSPYMVYFQTEDLELMSTSPETLVRLEQGRLTTFPVAGSRPRGQTEAEDAALEAELRRDEKELAEHNMLVDLGRNDLGRISRFGTVEVTKYQMLHKYSRIMHLCSQVEGEIREDRDALDAIQAVLPAGTLSGAPKLRACQIIEDLEPAPRGLYGGALGYLDFTGNMDTCIAIRMAVRQNGRVTVQAGGGIVADSVPDKEYEESGHKARAVIQALQRAREVDA